MTGKFIVIEGADGCGKSTQAKLLADALEKEGLNTLFCREPGGTPIGEKIRSVLSDPQNKSMKVQAELFLYMASRSQLVEEVIKPALAEGRIVICDRFILSSVVYQGIVGGFGEEEVFNIGKYAVGGLKPDITIVIDIPNREAFKRVGVAAKDQGFLFAEAPDREERKGKKFQEEVYNAYRRLAKEEKIDNIVVINGKGSPELVHEKVLEAVHRVI
ncbi:MAG: dTMP kinase [Planctomycetota bacterium]